MINSKGLAKDELIELIQEDNFIGWVYSIDYDKALIITNDRWKNKVKGVPHNSFLVATSMNPTNDSDTPESDKEIILLRVIGTCKLPQDDDMIIIKINNCQNKTDAAPQNDSSFDSLTRNSLQYGGLECRVLGTFYMKEQELNLGSDVESFSSSLQMSAYIPTGRSLEKIVNFVDPIRKKSSAQDFKELGIKEEVKPFQIGTVRYTSTDRLRRSIPENNVNFYIQPADFLARRTAVLGMTRTGKSNMIKQTVSVVKKVSDTHKLKIGQLIFDINGEYANANQQDNGSISTIFEDDCIRYRMIKTEGFKSLLNNFYEQLPEGIRIIKDLIKVARTGGASDIETFINMSFDKPEPDEIGELKRWDVKVALYKVLLHKAGYQFKGEFKVRFEANKDICKKVNLILNATSPENNQDIDLNPRNGLNYKAAEQWFLAARETNRKTPLVSSSKNNWFDSECVAMLNLLEQKNTANTFIRGFRALEIAKDYHSPSASSEVYKEIYTYLLEGKIVILDLSVGNAQLRERVSQNIAEYIFNTSMNVFVTNNKPINIVIYIEEAHNLIGKGMELTETWPRLAKEGAKYKIALVYATQEVSSVHKNILSNTENWFISHLNNDIEVRELAHFYDFADFSKSLLRSQDVGFTRVKTLSSPYVVPIQIDKFDPNKFKPQG